MAHSGSHGAERPPELLLISTDGALAGLARGAIGAAGGIGLTVVADHIRNVESVDIEATRLIVADIDASDHRDLVSLQGFMSRIGGRVPVIVVTPTFDDAVARWFLQIRVADFLRKPVDPAEFARATAKALQAQGVGDAGDCRILSFLPAAGGVGVTTLAIEAAMLLMRASRRAGGATCLVDLDLEQGACADYLDIEPRLDLDEILPHPERLDLQLLEVMFSRHASGLMVIAAPQRAAALGEVAPGLVVRLLDLVSARFENVVIDLPRHWRPWTDQVLAGSDRVLVVTDASVPGLRAGRRIAVAVNERLKGQAAARVVVNRFEPALLFGTGLRRAEVERVLEGLLAGTVANNYKLVREAIDRGVPLDDVKQGNPVSADLKRIVLAQADERSAGAARVA